MEILKIIMPGQFKTNFKGFLCDGQMTTDAKCMANPFKHLFTSNGQELARRLSPVTASIISPESAFMFPKLTTDFVATVKENA